VAWTRVDASIKLELHFIRFVVDLLRYILWLNGLVVSALGIRARGPGFDSQIVPLFHWVAATLDNGQVVYSHFLPSFSAPRNEYKKEFSAPKWLW